jgi:NAD(P)-dependent dehydrogenase (short-subunit alcohol dehydrogenase family)
MAERFGELGLHVAVGGRSTIHVPDSAEEGIGAHLDVADPESIEQFATLVEDELGPIDLWVNNAGVLDPMGPVRDTDPNDVRRALEVNVGGVIGGSATFARRARGWPPARRVLVNISSGAATSVYSGWSVYGATKAAVDHFTEIIDVEEPDLACFAVAPGVVDAGMQEQIRAHDESTFPAIDKFRRLHETGSWNSPAWVADHLAGLLTGALAPDGVIYRVPDEPRD